MIAPMKIKLGFFIGIVCGIVSVVNYLAGEEKAAYITLFVSFVLLIILWIWSMKKGLTTMADLGEAEIKHEEMERRFKVNDLYSPCEHTEDFLRGFAGACDFFIDNYLTDNNIGPTEISWYNSIKETIMNKTKPMSDVEKRESYRAYIIYSLCLENKIRDNEYDLIAQFVTRDNVRKTLGKTLYSMNLAEILRPETEEEMGKILK